MAIDTPPQIPGPAAHNWRERYARKLATPDDAVRVVRDGDRVVIGMHYQTPLALCRALAARADELQDVEIENSIATFISVVGRTTSRTTSPCGRSSCRRATAPAMRKGLLDYVIAPPTR